MSDVEASAEPARADAQEKPAASTTSARDDTTAKINDNVGEAADGDSEAETLIESPEKKKQNIIDSAPRLQATASASHTDAPPNRLSSVDNRTRKRKRKTSEGDEDNITSPKSSRRSSPLSSPGPHRSDDSDSEVPEKRSLRARNGGHGSDQESVQKVKLRRRRPSDIVPANGIGADGGRRETRSATYPRQSSAERSVSPKREHRRVASTQIGRRGRPLNINTRRKLSPDPRSSSSSTSPARTRPHLQKHASVDHDIMSPAKATGPRKHADKNGRTLLARACNSNNLADVMSRYAERPEDLNIPDYAGNTPLQIASLGGLVDIVKFLLESRCEVNTRNADKDTPLIDAVENGHLEVIKLLLEHGADPRIGNERGDEPYELVPAENPQFEEIRKLIADAKDSISKRRKSDDRVDNGNRDDSSRAASAASLRDSPPLLMPRTSPPPVNSSLRRRTGRSESTRNDLLWQPTTQANLARVAEKGDVVVVASILNILTRAETASVIAAAKAGHEEVLQLLLGMGNPDPDPDPIESADHKPGYNTPMLAAIGRGHADVVQLLANQSGFDPTRLFQGKKYYELSQERKGVDWQKEYDILKKAYDNYSSGKSRKHHSPRKSRELEKSTTQRKRESYSPVAVHGRGQIQSPAQSHKNLPGKESVGKHKRQLTRDRLSTDRSVAVSSDREPSEQPKTHKTRRSQSDLPTLDAETVATRQKRRRLISGKEHRSGKAHKRRQSYVSDEGSEESDSSVAIKEEVKEKPVLKRTRDSLTPDKVSGGGDVDTNKLAVKKRRTVLDSSSPEMSRQTPRKKLSRKPSGESVGNMQGADTKSLSDIEEASTDKKNTKSETVESKETMAPPQDKEQAVQDSVAASTESEVVTAQPGDQVQDTNSEFDRTIVEPAKSTGNPVDNAEMSISQAESTTDVDIVDAPPVMEPAEDPAVVEARKAQDEAARKAAEEAAEEERKAEELAAKQKAEEEAAARKKEEEERRERFERETKERQRRIDEQKRREFLEQERLRREALPSLLCKSALMLDQNDPAVRSLHWLNKFLPLYTVKTKQLDEHCSVELQDEEWVANFQVAGLLATKDLLLHRYTSLEKRPVTNQERDALWKVARNMLAFDFDTNAFNVTIEAAMDREKQGRPRFYDMAARNELLWVKLSGFEEQVERHPHLNGLYLKKQHISVQPLRFHPAPLQPVKAASPPLVNGITAHSSSPNGILPNGAPISRSPPGYFQR